MTGWVLPPPPVPSLAVAGSADRFPVRRIYCVGRNYLAHVREMQEGADERDPPFFFQKPADALVESGATIPYPPATVSFHHEVELVAAIGVGGERIALERALDHVWGYAVGIDLTRRDLQFTAREKSWPWEMGKSFDRSAPIGALVPAAVCGHGVREIALSVNGEPRQHSTTAYMTWSVAEIVAEISEQYRLEPGDLIMTGTPEGVGPLRPGDRAEATCEGLPPLSLTIEEARP